MTVRTYSYGALSPESNEDKILVERQLIMATRYRNALVQIERSYRAVVDPIYLKAIQARQAAKVEGKQSPALSKFLSEADRAAEAKARETKQASIREVRGSGGDVPFWGTYLVVEEAAAKGFEELFSNFLSEASYATARGKETFNPSLPRTSWFEGEGVIAVQLQQSQARSSEGILDSKSTMVKVTPYEGVRSNRKHGNTDRLRMLWLRIGSSSGRAPIWAKIPFVYHRPLPAEGTVTWVRVVHERIGTKTKLSVQFVVKDGCQPMLPAAKADTAVALDLGWRKVQDGIRVATWVDNEGKTGELVLPDKLLYKPRYSADIHGIREKNFAEATGYLKQARDQQSNWPEWIQNETSNVGQWKSSERLADLVWRWADRRFPGDTDIFEYMRGWRKKERHLWDIEAHQRREFTDARTDAYRKFSVEMAKYKTIVVKKNDYAALRRAPRGEEDYAITESRGRLFQAAPYSLVLALKQAAAKSDSYVMEDAGDGANTTCSSCGEALERVGAAAEVECGACKSRMDVDLNCARNLLRAVRGEEVSSRRSQAEAERITKENERKAKRAKGLETRRAKRSKSSPEVAVTA
jgi:transposase